MSDKHTLIQADRGQKAIDLELIDKAGFAAWAKALPPTARAAVEAQKFEGGGFETAIVPAGDGWSAVGGVADTAKLSSWCLAKLAETLPAGTYRLKGAEPGPALLGWVTAQYRFDRYREANKTTGPRILVTNDAKAIEPALAEAAAVAKVRDLVNTPAEDMGPAALEAEVRALGKAHKADVSITTGDKLEQEFPLTHAVGRAAGRSHAPRMIELVWGNAKHPRLAIVGKGVCFDSGGLDIKSASGMLLMKKDMGGAAHAIALAGLVMAAGLKVRLHLLVPAVENAIAGNAMRPGDVFRARGGISVEITNTDAEGRLVLADALVRAGEEDPEFILDFATLTGAARVALGPDLPALMARRDETAAGLIAAGLAHDDAVWRLPLPEPYREYLKSDIADLQNSPSNGFAGASVAGLFLDRFVPSGFDWAHFDTFAWRPVSKPGRPKGGEALGLRAAWHYLRERFG
ncbi:M17 family metallopeptidase [Novosphingobium sp. Gsoil 351]|uniref:leucyl aminopeptidase family protein n=1 Tax=Novosphingobium sp. Gsoil 351 TaxID=2675225 RepID=UPI0012B4AAFD|nr:leucyl aminopeptidase family protein [Novosphingobium sp. Gsoil 351]QGN55349.1 leucyl aminopeptidase family protein [Novosphingobium sp. Gsoil 351]